jgi:large subunit ribosomal protein L15
VLDQLTPRPGARHRRKRVGRGPGSGLGKTCGTGTKGQGTRSGGGAPAWFEGGQMPLQQRVPKRGFTNKFRVQPEIVNLGELAGIDSGTRVDPELLARRGLIRGSGAPVKLLGAGDAPAGITVVVHRVSASAKSKLEAAGGTVELIG